MVSHWKLIKKNQKRNFGPLPSMGIVKSHKGENIPKTEMEIEKEKHERASSHAVDVAPL